MVSTDKGESHPTPAYKCSKTVEEVVQVAVKQKILTDASPLALFMDNANLRDTIGQLKTAFPIHDGVCHCFAIKANPLTEVLKMIFKEGLGAECASIVEVEQALRLGVLPHNIVFDSPCKTSSEILRCIQSGIVINLDSMDEVERVASLVEAESLNASKLKVGVRINPQIGSGTIKCTSTATKSSKFGVPLDHYRKELVAAFLKYDWLTGLHCHVGSQGCSIELLIQGAKVLCEFASDIEKAAGKQKVRFLDIGGGLSVDYLSGTDSSYERNKNVTLFETYFTQLREAVPDIFTSKYNIYTEFGRSIVQKSGFLVSKVENTKIVDGRNLAICHIGANLVLRTCYLPDTWKHNITVHSPEGSVKTESVAEQDVAGPLCFSGDIIAQKRSLPQIKTGDLVVVHDCGGYTYGMYSKYNSRSAPPVYSFEDDISDSQKPFITVKKAESIEETLQFWD
eukprot:CAMPEP_0184039098 /NCGR_PEP_ID=MMETSP0955-20130417/50656_1 /TAXON_ID=627963 /ORGANISM="Aplanochytrium sp, Strain PBS07" /LENGTH=452 /DNA_ID=CAMNT_0026328067 /DNA_START=47 /DNA_END=1405 /DNA_ORIENTATION=+